jgi:hypothetical protein
MESASINAKKILQIFRKFRAHRSTHRESIASAAGWIDGPQTNRRTELTGLQCSTVGALHLQLAKLMAR